MELKPRQLDRAPTSGKNMGFLFEFPNEYPEQVVDIKSMSLFDRRDYELRTYRQRLNQIEGQKLSENKFGYYIVSTSWTEQFIAFTHSKSAKLP
jgi:hypothetical protein